MYPEINSKECITCEACVERCPAGVLIRYGKEINVLYPENCCECETCVQVCNQDAIKMIN